MFRIIGLNSENSHMSAFTPEGFSNVTTEFAVESESVGPDFYHRLFELMMEQVEVNPRLGKDEAFYLYGLAHQDPRQAYHLMNRCTRPEGFNGANAL
jgi:hypothetical protein